MSKLLANIDAEVWLKAAKKSAMQMTFLRNEKYAMTQYFEYCQIAEDLQAIPEDFPIWLAHEFKTLNSTYAYAISRVEKAIQE